jgi:flagellar biosynthesis protein FlhB
VNEKPLPPSEKRLRDAREKGDAPRSEPLIAWLVLAFCIEVVFACFDSACRGLLEIMQSTLTELGEPLVLTGLARSAWLGARFLASALAIVAATAALAAIVGARACASLQFAPKALAPSLKRLHPLNHIKQMFSTKHLTSIAIALATALLIGLVGYAALVHRLPLFAAMLRWQSVEHGWVAGVDTLHSLLRLLLAVLIAPAIVSKLAAKGLHLRKLRMSHREAREELKQTTGDPLVRARQRAALYETASAPPGSNVTAGFTAGCALVTNPEHLAVMLYYEGDERSAPVILDKGADEAAWRLADAAQSHSVPVFRFRKLARRLYEHGETNSIIPPDCYRAVAIVYRLVEEIQTLGACPVDPVDIDDAFFDE